MKLYNYDYLQWVERKNKKNKKIFYKNKKRKKKKKHIYMMIDGSDGKKRKVKVLEKCLECPNNLSLIYNTEETIKYFNSIINQLKIISNRFNSLFIDASNITNVSIDALMYLLAIVYNINNIKSNIKRVRGNSPKEKNSKSKFIESGFIKIMKNKSEELIVNDTNKQQILLGKDVDGKLASKIVDLASNYFNYPNTSFKFLYDIIIELMTNTESHAYKANSLMINSWYLYSNCEQGIMHITFLDTGLGIPDTINKKFYEKLKDKVKKNDTEYILSALKGEFRTRTKMINRNKGLPEIFNYYKNNKIENLKIISCRGKINNDIQYVDNNKIDLNHYLNGTVFYWEISANILNGIMGVK